MADYRAVLLSAVFCIAAASFAEAPEGYTTVDIMAVYTPAALTYAGGETAMNALIVDAVQQANEVHTNSNTQVYLNLVHTARTDYTEAAIDTDLYRLTNQNDGYMDEVHTLRDQYNADFVCLFSYNTLYTGFTWQLYDSTGEPDKAFGNISVYHDPIYYYSLVRNLALNMGCGYSKTQAFQPSPSPGMYSYSHGWQWADSQSPYDGYCTVMTMRDFDYNNIDDEYEIVPHFSNPDINYTGAVVSATGDAAEGDNARTIRQMRAVFAAYRGSGTEPPPPPPATSNYTFYAGFETDFDGWSSDIAWTRQTGETPNKNTGPTRAAEDVWYVYADSVDFGGETALLWKTFDFSSVSEPELGFWRHMYGKNTGTLAVEVSTDNGAQWNEIWSEVGEQNLSWRWISCPLTAYEGQSNVTIRFSAQLGSRTSDMALDAITVTGMVTAAESSGDQDGDGLPDDWETLYFGGVTNAVPEAAASNGVNTVWEAYVAGINPTAADSQFAITRMDGAVHWFSVSGRVYSVWYADNLHQNFQPLATNIFWPQSNYVDTVSCTQRFYKVGVQLAE